MILLLLLLFCWKLMVRGRLLVSRNRRIGMWKIQIGMLRIVSRLFSVPRLCGLKLMVGNLFYRVRVIIMVLILVVLIAWVRSRL